MMTKWEIVQEMASARMVEAMVQNIAHQSLSPDLKDLCQMIYLILLEYDEEKLQDLWLNNQMNFFIARIIVNQYRSSNSPFHTTFRKFQERAMDITGMDWEDEGNGHY
jgi:hypothetical protein